MTDEEKAEEFFCEHCENSFEHDNGHCSNCSKWDYFIAGLAEGRKEQIEKEFHKHNLYVENKRLKKSTRELVEKKTKLEKEKFELQEEKEKLKQEIEDWKNRCAEIYWDS